MRDEDLKRNLSEFPQNRTLSDHKKEQMKQNLRNELVKEQVPPTAQRNKKWVAGIAGVAALALFLVTLLSLNEFSTGPKSGFSLAEEKAKEEIKEDLKTSEVNKYSWSPDGRTVVFKDKGGVLSLRSVEDPSTTTAVDTKQDLHSFRWSPDSEYVQVAYRNGSSYLIRYYDARTQSRLPFDIPEAPQIPLWGQEGSSIATALLIQDEEDVQATIIHDFEEGVTRQLLLSTDKSYRVMKYSNQDIKVVEINEKNGHETDLAFNKKDGKWEMETHSTKNEPYSKAYIEETLQNDKSGRAVSPSTVLDYEWSTNGEKVIFTEVKDNHIDLKQWNVGEESPLLLQEEINYLFRDIESIRWMGDQEALVVLEKREPLNSTMLPYAWLTADLNNQQTSEMRVSASIPVLAPDGDKVVVSEGQSKQYESVIMVYPFDGNKAPQQIYGLEQNGGGLSTLYVESWSSPRNMTLMRKQATKEAPIRLEQQEEGGWKRMPVQEPIPLLAFSKPPISQTLPSEKPYGMWEEVKEEEIGGAINGTVHFYRQFKDDPDSPVIAYIERAGYWYRIGEVARIQDDFSAERLALTGKVEGIAIHGYRYNGNRKVAETVVIRYQTDDHQFRLIEGVPNFSRLDLDEDGNREIIGSTPQEVLLYDLTGSLPNVVSLNEAIGASSVTIKEVNGQEMIYAQTRDGRQLRYSYKDSRLLPVK